VYNKKIKFARCAGWDANMWASSLRSDFSPHVRAPYLKVSYHGKVMHNILYMYLVLN